MSIDFFDLLKDWGLGGVLGMGGCYLVVGSIAGRIIPIGNSVPPIPIRTRKQRFFLALFGCVLALPIIWSAYGQVFFGTPGRLFKPPETVEKVTASKTSKHRLRGELLVNAVQLASFMGGPLVTPALAHGESCSAVESFGLEQRDIRQLKFEPFQGRVYVYVGDVHSVLWKPTKVFVVIGEKDSWPSSGQLKESEFYRRFNRISDKNKAYLEVHRSGEAMSFSYAGRRYRLTVTEVYAVLLGVDKIAIEICEMPGGDAA
jgi:hypothetical protein